MKISINWLKDYVDLDNNYKILEDKFNLMSQEVESLTKLVNATNLVIGHVVTCEKHPEADKLQITTVNIGEDSLSQIICGAPNVAKGQKVIVAKVGSVLPGDFKIKKAKIRGVESYGMICSLAELGVQDFDSEEDGIYVLGEDAVPGNCPLEYLSLDDYVLDLDLTANRPDLLSMEGVAYDTACMLDKDLNLLKHKYETNKDKNDLKVFTDTSNCDAYYGQIIEKIVVKESPYWLKARLLASGVRPINNVVDITNYVMLEFGQPLHAFDYDKFKSDTVMVRRANKDEILITLDKRERKLVDSDIVITDGNKVVALAGVMGGLETEVSKNTKTIILEAASFNPVSIRKTSKRFDLKSESSTRFEKGIDPNKIKKALDYATELFIKLADGEVKGQYTFFDNTNKAVNLVRLSLKKINRVTGMDFDTETVEKILDRLRFDYKVKSDDTFKIEVPSRRQNVYGYQDIIEEIVRIHGYDKIPLSLSSTPTPGYLTAKQKLRRTIKNYFMNQGFDEMVTYSLVGEEQVTQFDIEELSKVEIMNPINRARRTLRHSIIPSLIQVLSYNKKRKLEDISLFEIGRKYTNEVEPELLSGLMHGMFASSLWQGKKEVVDFYLLKGILEGLLEKLHIEKYEVVKTSHNLNSMHPGIHADLIIAGQYAGFLGKLHPELEKKNNLNKTYVFELDFDLIAKTTIYALEMKEIPKYPEINRDLAVILSKDIEAKELINVVKVAGKKQLKKVEIFDIYEGENIDSDKKSVALSLKFQSLEKTLETEEVEKAIARILKQLDSKLNAKLR